ncbi:MAG: phosphoribosylformylglycinamidine synthase subunit PurL [Anaerolineae bacterium]|nr:phosphoribosylformylglycinamidine synthase subunit PurL [Anaerolineae bacterium]
MNWINAAAQAGIPSVTGCFADRLFFISGHLTRAEVERLAADLLVDPVTEQFAIVAPDDPVDHPGTDHTIEVIYRPGVTDPAAENLLWSAHLVGLDGIEQAATGSRFLLRGDLSPADLTRLAVEVFSNPLIQHHAVDQPIAPPFVSCQSVDDTVERIPLTEADDAALQQISVDRRLALNLAEMQAVQAYFQSEGREPTDVELEMLAQTWSEHCSHKTFNAVIDYTGPLPGVDSMEPVEQRIDGLLDSTIRAATDTLNPPWIRSAFVDNAGIIAFDDRWDLAFKLETHNHPSALEPFGGANTGVGGVVRDVLGVSARPIANTDVLCFGPPDLPASDLLPGVLHPRRIAAGVIAGIEDYGNKMGIPTVNGAILYHPDYTANPLVYCGCLGILPHGSNPTELNPGDLVIVIGGRTGRDGLRGATFSSMEMDQSTGELSGGAVQIGHPINEKQVMEVVLQACDEKLYSAITDCGAGGLSSAVGELGRKVGVQVWLDTVPLKYPGLRPWEIWLSEAQERMVLAVPPDNLPRLEALCAAHDVEIVCIGEFQPTGRIALYYGDHLAADLSTDFLHDGQPARRMTAIWEPPAPAVPDPRPSPENLSATLLDLLAHPDIRSKEDTVRRYDHEVQGGTAVKPLVGTDDHGPGDATVLVPLDVLLDDPSADQLKGVALSVGICPQYTEADPYAMAWAAVDEAFRNLVAVGADPDQVALLDNFCWGSPDLPDRLGSLVRCAQGCHDAALAYGAPFISGKDSLNNEFIGHDGEKHAIPGTLLISALGIVPDVEQTVTMDFKSSGNLVVAIGETRDELGGSHYTQLTGRSGGSVPQPDANAPQTLRTLHRAIRDGLIRACHDCSEGGLAVALAEMCIAGHLGASIRLTDLPCAADTPADDLRLFSESSTRFVVEVRPADFEKLARLLDDVPHALIGHVSVDPVLDIRGTGDANPIHLTTADCERAWRGESSNGRAAASIRSALPAPTIHTRVPKVCVLHARGTNRDREAALACRAAGGDPEIVHVNQLISGERTLADYHMLVLPGGFSYGDDLGAGTLWALILKDLLGNDVRRFVDSGRPVLGICNGFQALVKAGLLPGSQINGSRRPVTLTNNERRRFECRWVVLRPQPGTPSLFLNGPDTLITCPVAHGEGRLVAHDRPTLDALKQHNLIALTYVDAAGDPVDYPGNPNGSALDIAGLCNPEGNVLGLMPHPEDHIFPWQHPRAHRGESGLDGLTLFRNGVNHA